MADNRIHPSIAERLDILFNLRLNRWRRWRRIACWLGGILPLGLLGWSLWPGQPTVYQSGALSTVHQGIDDNCRACHVKPFQPLHLLTGTAEDKRKLEEQACGTCHPNETTYDHNELFEQTSVAARAVDCFDCHQEHQDADQLLAVADAHCVICHGNLAAIVSQPGALHFDTSIDSFHAHPEFAVVDPERNLKGTVHAAAHLVDAGSHQDQSPFNFDHAVHLNPEGVLLPHAHPDYIAGATRKTLGCSDCHTVDSSGEYMQPISYQQHCADCHPLVFTTKLAQPRNSGNGVVRLGTLPHGSEEALHGVVRDRLIAFAREQKVDVIHNDTARPTMPNKPGAATAPTQNEYELAERELNGIHWGKEIVQQSLGATGRVIRQGCAYCHQFETNNDFDPFRDFPWKVARNDVGGILPDRWMPHSRFRHDRHDSFGLDALERLLQAEGIEPTIDLTKASPKQVADAHCLACHQGAIISNSASNVLMPSIHVCKNCHASTASNGIGFARPNCVECHDYHGDHAVDAHSPGR